MINYREYFFHKISMFISRKEWSGYGLEKFLTQKFKVAAIDIKSSRGIENSSFLDICIKENNDGLNTLKEKLPSLCRTKEVEDKQGNKYLAIPKADLLRCKNSWMNNPFRQLAKKEADVFFLNTFFAADKGIEGQHYINSPKTYKHDQRAAAGKGQQFINWLYNEDGYPGRINHDASYYMQSRFNKSPVIFLDPNEHLHGKFTFQNGCYKIEVTRVSPLYSAILRCNTTDDGKAHKIEIDVGPDITLIQLTYQDLERFTAYLLGKGKDEAEKDLIQFQQKMIIGHQRVQDKQPDEDQSRKDNENVEVAVEANELNGEQAIKALDKALQIFSRKAFFEKFTKGKGVLQAEIYYTWLIGQIHTAKEYFAKHSGEIDSSKFTDLFNEIGDLLLIYDFLTFKQLKVREAALHLTKQGVDDLFCKLLVPDGNMVDDVFMSDPIANMLGITHTVKDNAKEVLDEYFAPIQRKYNEKDVEKQQSKILAKDNRQAFIGKLQDIAPNIAVIRTSSKQRVKEVLYNIVRYIPILSLFSTFLNPANSRVTTNYKRGYSLYCKNREIYETDISKEIREGLNITASDKKYVPSKHEAKCLVNEFRKKKHMMGAKERFLFKIKKNRVLWLPCCIILSLVVVSLSVVSRVLLSLHITPISPVDKILVGIRGLFESSLFIFGVDTFLDLILLRAVDFVALTINYIDRYLLGSFLRSTIRLFVGIVSDIYFGIKNGIKACLQSYIDYGFVGSLSLAVDNLRSSIRDFQFSNITKLPLAVFKYCRDKIFFKEDVNKSIGFNIPIVSLFYNLHANYSQWQKSKNHQSALLQLKENDFSLKELLKLDKDLDPVKDISALKVNLAVILAYVSHSGYQNQDIIGKINALKDALHGNIESIKKSHGELKKAIKDLGDEEGKLQEVITSGFKVYSAKQDWRNFAQNQKAIESNIPSYAEAKVMQAKSLCHSFGLDSLVIYGRHNAKNDIARKHNATNAVIKEIEACNVIAISNSAEPVFTTNQQCSYVLSSLKCYRQALNDLHDGQDSQKNAALLECLNYSFRKTFSEAFYLMNKGMNEVFYTGLHSASLLNFSNEFAYYIHGKKSSEIKDVTHRLLLSHGKISALSVAKEHFVHFVKEYQEPKRLLLLLMAMSILKTTPLKVVPETLSNSLEQAVDKIPYMDALHHIVNDNKIAGGIECLYGMAEVPRDFIAALEMVIHTLGNTEEACEHDCHGSYTAEVRVKNVINLVASCILYILGISVLQNIAIERSYNKKQVMQNLVLPYVACVTAMLACSTLLSEHYKLLKPIPLYVMTSLSIVCFLAVVTLMFYSYSLKNKVVKNVEEHADLQINEFQPEKDQEKQSTVFSDSGVGSSIPSERVDGSIASCVDEKSAKVA